MRAQIHMATAKLQSLFDVLNHYDVGAFVSKSDAGRAYVVYTADDGKRRFANRIAVKQLDGSIKWEWSAGDELVPAETVPAKVEINVA